MIKLFSYRTRHNSYYSTNYTVLQESSCADKMSAIKIFLKAKHPYQVSASTSSVIHAVSCTHVQNHFLNIISLAAFSQHSYPEIIILKSWKILIITCPQYFRPAEHDTWVIKRITLLCIFQYFFGCSGKLANPIHISRFRDKLLKGTADNSIISLLQQLKLSLTAVRSADIITVHPCDHFTAASGNPCF